MTFSVHRQKWGKNVRRCEPVHTLEQLPLDKFSLEKYKFMQYRQRKRDEYPDCRSSVKPNGRIPIQPNNLEAHHEKATDPGYLFSGFTFPDSLPYRRPRLACRTG